MTTTLQDGAIYLLPDDTPVICWQPRTDTSGNRFNLTYLSGEYEPADATDLGKFEYEALVSADGNVEIYSRQCICVVRWIAGDDIHEDADWSDPQLTELTLADLRLSESEVPR